MRFQWVYFNGCLFWSSPYILSDACYQQKINKTSNKRIFFFSCNCYWVHLVTANNQNWLINRFSLPSFHKIINWIFFYVCCSLLIFGAAIFEFNFYFVWFLVTSSNCSNVFFHRSISLIQLSLIFWKKKKFDNLFRWMLFSVRWILIYIKTFYFQEKIRLPWILYFLPLSFSNIEKKKKLKWSAVNDEKIKPNGNVLCDIIL